MIAALFATLWAMFVEPIVNIFRAKHANPYAVPTRAPPNPKHFPYYFQNAQGLWLRWTEWKPADATKTPAGVLFIVTGLGEHSGRWDSVALRFATERNFHVFALDHQGQGLSEGDRTYVERVSHFVDDLQQFVRLRLDADGGRLASLPRFVLGHSMGGLITVRTAQRNPRFWSGVILSAPALASPPEKATPLLKAAARFLGRWAPKLGLEALPIEWVSNNRQITEFYSQDPAVPRLPLRARWAAEMMANMDLAFADRAGLDFPFAVVHGTADRLVPIAGSERLMQTSPSKDKTIFVYEGASHEMFTDDAVCERVFEHVFGFVDSHMKPPAA